MSNASAAREEILDRLRAGRRGGAAAPSYVHPAPTGDLAGLFVAKATAADTRVTQVASLDHMPEAIWAALRETNAAPRLHLPRDSELNALPWQRAPGLEVRRERPSGQDAALSAADYGIAETGTKTPSSWHFLPGHEFVLIRRERVLPRLEEVISRLGAIPATINLVTGPSRTADIEQTIERGAHGPRELHILLIG